MPGAETANWLCSLEKIFSLIGWRSIFQRITSRLWEMHLTLYSCLAGLGEYCLVRMLSNADVSMNWIKMWQHRTSHCIHVSVAAGEWWKITVVTQISSLFVMYIVLYLSITRSQRCLWLHYQISVAFRKANKWFSIFFMKRVHASYYGSLL